MSRPSDGMTLDELRDEFDWMLEFNSRMAERICEDPDVHSLASYVTKLETENAKLQGLATTAWKAAAALCEAFGGPCSPDYETKEHRSCPLGDDLCIYGKLQGSLRDMGIEAV